MRGGTLLILVQGVKGQGQLGHSVYKTLWAGYRLQFVPDHLQTSHVSCGGWEEEPYWFWVMGSKVKVNFGTLCIRPCGQDTDYSFFPITFKTSHVSYGWWEEELYWFWVTGSKVKVNFCTLCIRPCGQDTYYRFSPITQTSHCNLWVMRGGTLLILGHGVKGQGQLWHSVYKALWAQYRLQFMSIHFQTSHVGCRWWGEKPYWFWVTGHRSRSTLPPLRGDATLCVV